MRNLLFVFAMFMFGCATVEPGDVGIGIDLSGVQEELYQPGTHFVSPTTDVVFMSLQTQTYEMTGADEIHALTQDQLSVQLEVTINFALNEDHVIDVYKAYSVDYDSRIVHPIVRTAVRDAASSFSAQQLVNDREGLQTRMEERVRNDLASTLRQRNLSEDAIRIENVMLRNIDLPDSLDASIAAVQEQRMQTQQRQQALETARAEAERLRTEAEGHAAAQQIRAEAEALANRTVAQSLTPAVLEARRIQAMQELAAGNNSRVVLYPANTTPAIRVDTSTR